MTVVHREATGSAFLSRLVRLSIARPALTVVVCLALALAGAAYTAARLTFQTSSLKLLSPHHLYVQRFTQLLHDFGELNDLVVVVEAPTVAQAKRYADHLAVEITALPEAGRVTYRIDPDLFKGHTLLYLTVAELGELCDKLVQHRRFIERYAGEPTLAALLGGLSDEIARRFAVGFIDLRLDDDNAPRPLDAGFIDGLLSGIADDVEGKGATGSPWTRVFTSADDDERSGYFLSSDRKLLFVLVEARREEGNFTDNQHLVAAIRRTVGRLHGEFPDVAAGVTGAPALSNDEMVTAFHDSSLATTVALVLTLGILVLVCRRFVEPIMLLAVLVVSLAWSLGIITATVGHLTVFSVMFISLLIGIGIDYGIYVWFRYEEERQRGLTHADALDVVATRTGPGILFGAFTAAATFGVLMLTEFRGIQEFGFIAGVSILVAFVAMMTLFPATLTLRRQRMLTRVRAHRPAGRTRVEVSLLERLARHRTSILVVTVLLTLYSLAALPAVRFDYNRLNLQAKGTDSVIWERKIMASGRSGFAALTTADSLAELRDKRSAFEQLPAVSDVVSLLTLVPVDQDAKIALIRTLAPLVSEVRFRPAPDVDVDAVRTALDGLRRRLELGVREADPGDTLETLRSALAQAERIRVRLDGADRGALVSRLAAVQARLRDDVAAKLTRLQENLDPRPLTTRELPDDVTRRFAAPNGRLLMRIYPAVDTWSRDGARQFITQLRTIDAAVTGPPVITYEASRLMEKAYFYGTLAAIVVVAALAVVMLRRPLDALLALTPLGLGTLWTIGVMHAVGLPFNLANVWGLPLIVGAAAEYGLAVTLRHRESGADGAALPASTVTAVLLNGLTNLAGFGSLMVARHRGMFGLGLLLCIGALASLLSSLVILPALLRTRAGTTIDHRHRRKMTMNALRTLVIAALFVLTAGAPPAATAPTPSDQLRADINEVYQTFQRGASPVTEEREVTPILDRMFDWPRMAEAALRNHWAARTPVERAEFTRLFAQLFRRAYVSRVHVVDASKFRYLGDTVDRDRATVKTQVFTKKGSAIDVGYAVRLAGDQRWRIDDVTVESMSLVENYRVQFDVVIGRSSYGGFVAKLRQVATR
jgi:hypothetical protein